MTITRSGFRLQEFEWINKVKKTGPDLRFTLVWSGVTEEDLTPALSIPGFSVRRNQHGDKYVFPPIKSVGMYKSYHAVQVSTDLANWILDKLRETKYWALIGQNYRPEKLLDIPDDLLPSLPEGLTLY